MAAVSRPCEPSEPVESSSGDESVTDQIAIVTKTAPATNGDTVDFTDPSITETFSAAILIFTQESTDDANHAHASLGLGFLGVTSGDNVSNQLQCTAAAAAQDGVTSGQNCVTVRNNAACIRCSDANGGVSLVATYDSTIPNGVKIKFNTTKSGVKVTAILFAGLSKAATGDCTFTQPAPSHENVGKATDLFQPDLLIFIPADNVVNADTLNGVVTIGYALNKSGIPQISSYANWDDSTDPTDADGYYRTDCCSAAFTGTVRTTMDRFQVTSFDSTGFNGQAVVAATSPQANYLALKFSGNVRMAIAHFSVAASTGLQNFTDFGFSPALVFGMSHLMTTADTLTDGATTAASGYFVTGGYGSRAVTGCNQEGLNINPAPTVARTRQGDHALLLLTDTASVAQQAEFSGPITNGFVLNFSTATNVGTLTALGLQLGHSFQETESISESVTLLLDRYIFSETETISESVVMRVDHFLSLTEEESIEDGLVFIQPMTEEMEGAGSDGAVFQACVQSGDVFNLGPVDGDVTTN
jgi:hypothetical protein